MWLEIFTITYIIFSFNSRLFWTFGSFNLIKLDDKVTEFIFNCDLSSFIASCSKITSLSAVVKTLHNLFN